MRCRALRRMTDEDSLPGIREVLSSFGIEVRQAMNQLVLITTTSAAQPVAAGIDYEDWPEVVGTIAGDDTVLDYLPRRAPGAHGEGANRRLYWLNLYRFADRAIAPGIY